MGKTMAIEDYSTSAASNLLLGTIPVGPGMAREKVNDAFQQLMADIKTRFVEQQIWVKDYGAAFDDANDDTTEIGDAIAQAAITAGGALGSTVNIPRGVGRVSAAINIPNRVTIAGVNKRGSVIRATSGHTGPYMMTVVDGTSSMFDNPLKDLTIDCNSVAGLGGVDAQAWQEGGGLRNVLVQNFRTIGVRIRDGFGGAALLPIDNAEIFASATAVATAGIKLEQISSVGNFVLSVKNTTIAGPAAFPLPRAN